MKTDIRLGFACKLVGEGLPNLHSLILRRLTPENLREIVSANFQALRGQFEYLSAHGLEVFRMCSDVIPFGSSPHMPLDWRREFAPGLGELGRLALASNLRLSMHPGQYTVLDSPRPEVVRAAAEDLAYHCSVLDLMGMPSSCKLVLHVGGVYGDRQAAAEAFARNYRLLSEDVRRRLVLENDERFSAAEVLALARRLRCPMVLDLHHDWLLPSGVPVRELLEEAMATWGPEDGRVKVHYSQSGGGRPGAHSATIRREEFLRDILPIAGLGLDLMLEVKDKNVSALHGRRWLEEAQACR